MRIFILRVLYSVFMVCISPWLLIRILLRARKNPQHINRLGERFGIYQHKLSKCIWLHTVSLGETIAATPLIEALLKQYPNIPLLITNMTLSGTTRVNQAFGDRVKNVYLPYDFPFVQHLFISAHKPIIGILFETELWPNLIAACKQHQIPLTLINARLSKKSADGYQKVASITRFMLNQLEMVGVHAQADGERFLQLGLPEEKLIFTGNIKFDLQIAPELSERSKALREQFGRRPVWIAASTHAGEESIILQAHKKIQQTFPDGLLILVPRHAERFDEVAELIRANDFSFVRRSELQSNKLSSVSVYLGDTMGELLLLYGCADIAFVGGSLIERGGHNILEPAALGKPVLMGKHMFNFAEITKLLIAAQGGIQIENSDTLSMKIIELFSHPDKMQEVGMHAAELVKQHRGALQKQLNIISKLLSNKIDRL